ncbi:MAG: M48 family metallopeptidase [Bacteroidota bacterium]
MKDSSYFSVMAKKSKVVRLEEEIQGVRIPVEVSYEWRRDIRYSVARSAAYLRLPVMMRAKAKRDTYQQFRAWLKEVMEARPERLQHFAGRNYQNGMLLQVKDRQYTILIKEEDRKTSSAKLTGETIDIKLARTAQQKQKVIRLLVSRSVAKDWLPFIEERVDYWNDHFFQKEINRIQLKLNHSNWGSCSSKRNINLSTRLLFAPDEVIDYIIVHELSHLIEMNHSPRFWKIVSDVMPDYKTHERWLKEHGHSCFF